MSVAELARSMLRSEVLVSALLSASAAAIACCASATAQGSSDSTAALNLALAQTTAAAGAVSRVVTADILLGLGAVAVLLEGISFATAAGDLLGVVGADALDGVLRGDLAGDMLVSTQSWVLIGFKGGNRDSAAGRETVGNDVGPDEEGLRA